MKRLGLILLVCAVPVLMGANSKTTSKYGSGMLSRPMNYEDIKYEHYTKFNKMVDDLDTIFAHIAGSYADSAYWAFIQADTISVSDSLYVAQLEGDTVTIDSAQVSFATIDTGQADSMDVYHLTADTATIDSAHIDDMLTVDSLRLNVGGVQAEAIEAADKYIWLNVNGTRYKLLLKAE